MRPWADLPYEILYEIFEHLDWLSEVQQCQLTCQSWTAAAHAQFFKIITLGNNDIIKKFIQQLQTRDIGKLVKEIHFGVIKSENLEEGFFENMFSMLPNLELISSPTDYDMWKVFTQLRQQGHLQLIKEIRIPMGKKHMEKYDTCMLAFRSTLEQLILGEQQTFWFNPQLSNRKQYDRLAQRLDEFPCIKQLSANIMTNKSMVDELEYFIDGCPNLEILNFLAYQPDERPVVITNRNISNLSTITPHQHLKTFEGDVTAIIDETVNYLMHKFPHLDSITLNKLYKNPYTRVQTPTFQLSATPMTNFFKYLTSMQHYEFWDIISPKRIKAAIPFFFKETAKNSLNIEYEDDPDCPEDSIFEAHKLKDNTNMLTVAFKLDCDRTILQHFDVLKRCGDRLDSLFINASQMAVPRNKREFLKIMVQESLEHVFKECTKLKTLTMCNMIISDANPDMMCNINESIETLIIQTSGFDTMSQMSTLAYNMPNIKHLKVKECFFRYDSKGMHKIFMPPMKLESVEVELIPPMKGGKAEDMSVLYLQVNAGRDTSYYAVRESKTTIFTSCQEFEKQKIPGHTWFRVDCTKLGSFKVTYNTNKSITFQVPSC